MELAASLRRASVVLPVIGGRGREVGDLLATVECAGLRVASEATDKRDRVVGLFRRVLAPSLVAAALDSSPMCRLAVVCVRSHRSLRVLRRC
jgi:hypothetical protein